MQVGVLGPLDVRVNGIDVTPRGQRLRDVFAVLWQRRGRPVPAGIVLDLVWGDPQGRRPAPGIGAVHTTISRLRRQLGPDPIASHDLGYLIDGADTDEGDFTELAGRARKHVAEGDFAAATGSYRAALATRRGREAYGGFGRTWSTPTGPG
jgi:DNA-binding SARP family transcriptional activator